MRKIQKMLMTDTFEVKGKWFLPESNIENSVEGVLRYSPHRIELDLIGSFYDLFSLEDLSQPKEYTIFGFSEYGEWYTLLDCLPSNAHISAPGFDSISYIVNRFYVGTKIVQSEETNVVNSSNFSFLNIDAWLKYSPLEITGRSDHHRTECIIDMNSPKLSRGSFDISPIGLMLSEELYYMLEFPKDYFLWEKNEIIIQRFFSFSTSTGSLCSLQKMTEYIHQLRRLLTMLIGAAMYFKYIDFTIDSSEEDLGNEEVEVKHSCRMFFCQVGDIEKAKHFSSRDSRFTLLKREDLHTSMGELLNRWYEDQEKLGEIVNPYISDLYLPAYIENKFLSVVKGLETYHRSFCESIDMKCIELSKDSDFPIFENDKKMLIDYIADSISPQNQKYFVERLFHEDEATLRERLRELFKLIPESLALHCFEKLTSNERNKLLSSIIDTRNYYTHRDKKRKYRNLIISREELNCVINRLSVLLQFFVLTELGISKDLVAQRLSEKIQRQF